jgi:signal transduction histidine kinase
MNTQSAKIEGSENSTPAKGETKRRRFGLWGKLMLGILAAGTIPIVTGLLVAYVNGTNQLRQVIGDSFTALAQHTAMQLDREIQHLITFDRLLARRAATDFQLLKALSSRASTESSESPLERLYWSPPAGTGLDNEALLVSWVTGPEGAPIVDMGEVSTGPIKMSEFRFDENIGRYVFRISASIADEQGELLGWLHRDYDVKIFLDPLVYPIRFGQTGHIMIVDNNGVIVSCPALITGSRIQDAALVERIATTDTRWIISENDGHGSQRTSLIGHAPLSGVNRLMGQNTSWYVFVWQDSREIFAPTAALLKGVTLAGVIAVGLLGILGFYTSRKIVRPIGLLRDEVAHVRAGDLAHDLDIRTGHEIEDLAGEFDEMRLQLRELIENLEQNVAERTRELRRTEAEKALVVEHLIQAEKVATIANMASGIGHEINNPLYAIVGMAEAIQEENDISGCRKSGEDIIAQCRQISETIKNLSGYIRPGSERETEKVDVNEKLSDAVSLIMRSVENNQVKIRENLLPVPMILAKPEEIQQVFFNIINNGVQAMGANGNLEISTYDEDDQVCVKISDEGAGIRKELLGKIFDPFFSTKGPDQGDGLGLYIVDQITKKYNGDIGVESREGVGTTFTISFPKADQDNMDG